MAGCSGSPERSDLLIGKEQAAAGLGDLNDIDVAVGAGLGRAGIAPVGATRLEDGTVVYELRTARDEPGELRVRVGEPTTPGGPVPVDMTCRVGRFGNPDLEALIVESISIRLEQLRGRDVYRITWR